MTVHLMKLRYLPFIVLATSWLSLSAYGQQEPRDPDEATNLYNTAANLFGDKDYELAINQYEKLLKDYPDFSRKRDAQHYMALAHYNLQQYDKAVLHFTALRDSLPDITRAPTSSPLGAMM